MSILFRAASVAASAFFAFAAAGGLADGASLRAQTVEPVIQPLPAAPDVARADDDGIADMVIATPVIVASVPKLSQLQALTDAANAPVDGEQARCVATAVYFESKGEPMAGQLAVARVIMNRAKSGRFARTPCGVVTQPSQFSFVRRGTMPTPPADAAWRQAQIVARMVMNDVYVGPASAALFFHAKRVSPGWNRTTLGAIGNHIFYR